MTYATIDIESRGAVEVLTLNRPDALNAISVEMRHELDDYVSALPGRGRDVRVVVLRGAGRSFCAGLDIKQNRKGFTDGDDGLTNFQRAWDVQTGLAQVYRKMRHAPQPFIALGHGAACGGGFSLLLASDVRIGAPDLRMNAAYIKIGLGGADLGSSYFLPRLVGASLASELLLTGQFIEADRALAVGLLSRVVPQDQLLAAGLEMAEAMVANAPYGLALTKQALNINIDATSLDAAMALEDRQQVMLISTSDHIEAMNAFVEKRDPIYRGR